VTVDVNRLRRGKNPLGAPPAEASDNLQQPEIAPQPSAAYRPGTTGIPDGRRRLRRSRRTVPLTTRLTPEFSAKLIEIADDEDVMLVEVLEMAIDALVEKRGKKK